MAQPRLSTGDLLPSFPTLDYTEARNWNTNLAADNKPAIGGAVVLGHLIEGMNFRIGAHFPSVHSLLLPQITSQRNQTQTVRKEQRDTEGERHRNSRGQDQSTQKILTPVQRRNVSQWWVVLLPLLPRPPCADSLWQKPRIRQTSTAL